MPALSASKKPLPAMLTDRQLKVIMTTSSPHNITKIIRNNVQYLERKVCKMSIILYEKCVLCAK